MKYFILTFILISAAVCEAQIVSTILNEPCGDDFDLDASGNIISTDYGGNKVRRITPAGEVTVLLDGYTNLGAVELGDSGTVVAANWNNGFIIKIWPGGNVDTVMRGLLGPSGLIRDADWTYYINTNMVGGGSINQVRKVRFYSTDTVFASGQPMHYGAGMAFDEEGNLYIANLFDGRIIRISPLGDMSLFATIPGGPNQTPVTGYMDHSNGNLFVCNLKDNRIYKISTDISNPNYTVPIIIAGTGAPGYVDGPALTSQFFHPVAITASLTGDTLYIADGEGPSMRLRMIRGISTPVNQIGSEIPEKFALLQNYPNPFNPETLIRFEVANRSKVKLSVIDLLGKEVALLVENTLEPGDYEYRWYAGNITGGIYFFRMEADNFIVTKKSVLLK